MTTDEIYMKMADEAKEINNLSVFLENNIECDDQSDASSECYREYLITLIKKSSSTLTKLNKKLKEEN